jgi:cation transport regulator ChaC
VKYFAYGSNLDQVQMAQRCPGARLIGSAQLANHRICFPRRSPVRGCAVASFEAHKGGVVWGVIYELDDDDLRRLDEREGFDSVNPTAVNRYCRVDVTVQRAGGERVAAVAYVAVPEENPGRPSATYLKHIIEGAAAHSFPDDYIETLRAIAVIEDENILSAATAVDDESR